MAKLGNIFNKEEIKKEEQHPRRIIKWIHYSKLKENVEQYCPARDKEEIESLADLIQATGEVIENLSVSKLDTDEYKICLLYTSPSPRDLSTSRMPSSA